MLFVSKILTVCLVFVDLLQFARLALRLWIAQFRILVQMVCAKTNPVHLSPIVDLNSAMAPYASLVVPMPLKVRQGTALYLLKWTQKTPQLLVILMKCASSQTQILEV